MPKMTRGIVSVALTMFFVGVMSIVLLQAQSVDKATVTGTVEDTTGAVMVGVEIQAKDVGTGVTAPVATTDPLGRYTIPQLAVGSYQITATKPGFQKIVHTGITLTIGMQAVANFTLPVGSANEVIEVQGQVSQVQTQTATVSSLVAPRQVDDLPLNGRNFEQLLTLSSGVQTIPVVTNGGGASNSYYGEENNYSVSGSRPEGQAFLLDSQDITNFFQHGTGSGTTGTSLGIGAIQEFSVLTNTYSAQFGGNGAVINAASKPGTNSLHGSAYDFLRNSALDAKNYFDLASARIPAFRRNQFGGALGGPIKHDKAFFFANYEGLRAVTGVTEYAATPSELVHQGYIQDSSDGMVNYANGAPTGPSYLNPSMTGILALFPLPQTSCITPFASTADVGYYCSVGNWPVSENYALGRLDFNLGPKDALFTRYVIDRSNQTIPYPSALLPGYPEVDYTHNQFFTIEERRTFSPTLLNLLRFGASGTKDIGVDPILHPALDLMGASRGDTYLGEGIGAPPSDPFSLVENKFSVGDDVILSKGAHNITFGAVLIRQQAGSQTTMAPAGLWIFANWQGFDQGNAFVYLGAMGPNTTVPVANHSPVPFHDQQYFREIDFYPYFQDDWELSRKLTVNLGVRWEFRSNPVAAGGIPFIGILNPLTSTGYTEVPHVFPSNPSLKNIDPRVGLAWDMFGDQKTSLRAGFGMFHEPIDVRTYNLEFVSPSLDVTNFAALFGGPMMLNFPTAPPVGTGVYAPGGSGMQYDTSKTPYVMQYNLTIQRALGAGTILSIGYDGATGVHLFSSHEGNLPLAQSDATDSAGQPNPGYNPSASGPRGSLTNTFVGVPSNPYLASLTYDIAAAHSSYNSLQAQLNRQFSSRLTGQLAYTWSKCLDNGSSSSGFEGSNEWSDPWDGSYDRGPCTFNASSVFRLNGLYALPFKGNRLVDGWQVAPIFSASKGLPDTVVTGFRSGGMANYGIGIENDRPNLVPGCKQILGKVAQWVNPECFTLPAFGTLGNTPRDSVVGPGFMDLDFSVIKNTKLTERVSAQFRAEFFNILNHPDFANPSVTNLFTGGQSPSVSSNNPADYEPTGSICKTYGVCYTYSSVSTGGSQLTSTAMSSRQIQFALKLIF
jgi:hypothetical protein